ncbi:MAG TPA: response regulator [Herpetosiphonaceae bacterium]
MKTILIVDDEWSVLQMVTDVLEDEGYAVLSAANGSQALERLAAHQPDLVLCDLMMPVMRGADMARTMRATPRLDAVPLVMMSAGNQPLGELDFAHDAVLRKPFTIAALCATLETVLGQQGHAA